jgi:hypothetical protein
MIEGSSPPLGVPSRCVDCVEEHMSFIDNQARDRIRELDNAFRKSLDPNRDNVVMTSGVNGINVGHIR